MVKAYLGSWFCGLLSYLGFCSCDKIPRPKAVLWREVFLTPSRLESVVSRSQARNLPSRSTGRKHKRKLHTGSLSRLAQTTFLYPERPARGGTTHRNLRPPNQLRKCPIDMSTGQTDRGKLSVEIPSQMTLPCVKLIKI